MPNIFPSEKLKWDSATDEQKKLILLLNEYSTQLKFKFYIIYLGSSSFYLVRAKVVNDCSWIDSTSSNNKHYDRPNLLVVC